jgi:hypothetical protein
MTIPWRWPELPCDSHGPRLRPGNKCDQTRRAASGIRGGCKTQPTTLHYTLGSAFFCCMSIIIFVLHCILRITASCSSVKKGRCIAKIGCVRSSD